MRQFLMLYKAQLSAMFWSGNKKTAKKGKSLRPRSMAGQALLWVFVMALMGVYEFIFMSLLAAESQGDTAALASFPALVAFASMLLTVITTVSYAKTLLYEAKDYELLFSLPISGGVIVAAKIATLYTLDLIFSLAMMLPCGVFYGLFAAPSVTFYLFYFLLILFVPLIPILVACVVSALFSLIASRFRRTQMITIVLYAIFLCGVMSISFTMSSTTEEGLIGEMFMGALASVTAWYPPLAWFYEATVSGSALWALLFVGVSLACFALVALVIGKFYGRFQEIFRPRAVRRKYKAAEKSSGVMVALMKKDWKRLCSSAGIFMNQLVGLLMLVFFAVIFGVTDLAGGEEEAAEIMGVLFPFIFAMAASMVMDTSTSISLEGKTFPLIKSLPISPKTYLNSKIMLHMTLCAPVITLCGIGVSIAKGLSVVNLIACVVIPLCYAYSSGVIGLLINLKKYKFDWTSELMVAKNSLPVMLATFGGMILSLVPMGIAIALCGSGFPVSAVLIFFMALAVTVAVLMGVILNALGENLFMKIEY
ncbi:MAG: hypothetical protein IJV98_08255 [Clostridia bacterium]|nr:hypothetical protein [Clostridia bacterium]